MVRVGPAGIGLRANTHVLDRLLRRSFASHLEPATAVEPLYSIRVEPPPADPREQRVLHSLFRDCSAIVRSRDPRQVVDTLCQALAVDAELHGPADHLIVRSQLMTLGHRAVLLPPATGMPANATDGRLSAAGFRRLASRTTLIRAQSAELLVPEPFNWDTAAAREALGLEWSGPSPWTPASGRYRLCGWIFDDEVDASTTARALAHALRLVTNRETIDGHVIMSTLAVAVSRATHAVADNSVPSQVLELAKQMLTAGGPHG
jgi:hypothetical protein